MTSGPNDGGDARVDIDPMSAGTKVGLGVAGALALLVVALVISGAGHSSTSTSAGTGSVSTTTASGTTVPTATGPGVVHVTLSDTHALDAPMKLIADKSTVPAGKISFVIKNTGTIEHELVVLKLTGSQTWNSLPITDAGDPPVPVTSGANKVSEANDVADTGTNLKAGETRTLIATLPAGNYALVCNIAKHYGLGMRAGLTVS
jgi:uncharacterized cupredoxin-like copper-binding protein